MPRSAQDDLALHQGAHSDLVQLLRREPTESEIAAAAGSVWPGYRPAGGLPGRVSRCPRMRPPRRRWRGCVAANSSRALARVDTAVSVGAAVGELRPGTSGSWLCGLSSELSQNEIAARVKLKQDAVSSSSIDPRPVASAARMNKTPVHRATALHSGGKG